MDCAIHPAPCFFNPLLSVWISDEILFLEFDMLVLSDFDQSYSLYDIILVIYFIFYFCRPFSLIMEVFPPLSNT